MRFNLLRLSNSFNNSIKLNLYNKAYIHTSTLKMSDLSPTKQPIENPTPAAADAEREVKKPRKKYTTCKERKEHAISRLNRNNETWAPRENVNNEDREPRKPKKKCAILLGFVGTGYNGMQM
jgi:tRNA pseudouridine38-40 synthase